MAEILTNSLSIGAVVPLGKLAVELKTGQTTATLEVALGAPFTTAGATFRVTIDKEELIAKVKEGAPTILELTRAQEGTTEASHTVGTNVFNYWTAAGLMNVVGELITAEREAHPSTVSLWQKLAGVEVQSELVLDNPGAFGAGWTRLTPSGTSITPVGSAPLQLPGGSMGRMSPNGPATTITGTLTENSNLVTALSSTLQLSINQHVEGAGIPAATTIIEVNAGTKEMLLSNNVEAGKSGSGVTLTVAVPVWSIQSERPILLELTAISGNPVLSVPATYTAFHVPQVGARVYGGTSVPKGLKNVKATLTSASNIAVFTSTTNSAAGMTIVGQGIPAGTTVVAVKSSTELELSETATKTGPTLVNVYATVLEASPTSITLSVTPTKSETANVEIGVLQEGRQITMFNGGSLLLFKHASEGKTIHFTANCENGSEVLKEVSATAGIEVGMTLTTLPGFTGTVVVVEIKKAGVKGELLVSSKATSTKTAQAYIVTDQQIAQDRLLCSRQGEPEKDISLKFNDLVRLWCDTGLAGKRWRVW